MNWKDIRVIAVVGASANPKRDSNEVFNYLRKGGFEVIPINPKYDYVDGVKCYPSLLELPEDLAKRVDMVDIFRRSEFVLDVVKEAVELKKKHGNLKVVWMQFGAYNPDAEKLAKDNGLEVIANACAMVEHKKLDSKYHL